MRDKPCEFDRRYKEKPWLVQRMTFRKEARCKNPAIDDLMSMDYMGSAEFEFGALPLSMSRICKGLLTRKLFKYDLVDYTGEALVIYARCQEEADKYYEWIKTMMITTELNSRLKEDPKMWHHLPHEKKYENDPVLKQHILDKVAYGRQSVHAWWDIEYDVMFCFGHKKLKKICHSIENTAKKKLKMFHSDAAEDSDKERLRAWIPEDWLCQSAETTEADHV